MEFVKSLLVNNKADILLFLSAIFLGLYFNWGNMEIIIFAIFISSILCPISSRLVAIPALFFLGLVPLLLALERAERAEEFAVYAYYFLVMAVIAGIYEVRSEKADES